MRTLADAALLLHRGTVPGRGLSREDLVRIVKWGVDVLGGLERLHDRGLYHGEISPASIRIGAGGASLASPEEAPAGPEYRDPDRIRRRLRSPAADDRAPARYDVYGVGASLYFALEGGPPPCGTGSAFTSPVPPALAAVVYRALADGAGRYPSATAMRRDLERLARLARDRAIDSIAARELPGFPGGEVTAAPPLAPFRPRRRSRSREVALRSLVLVLLVAGGVATLLRSRVAGKAGAEPTARVPTAAPAAPAPRSGLAGLVDGYRARLGDALEMVGEEFDPVRVPLVLVSDVPAPADLGWPIHPSRTLTAKVREALHDGVTAKEVRDRLVGLCGADTLPAVLWLTPAGNGRVRARFYYSAFAFDDVR